MGGKERLPERKAKVTVREVARHAGVSESTVSRILRNRGLVAEATRAKVMEAVRALGYVPDRIAGSLASLDRFLVGVVVPSLSNNVFSEVVHGIQTGLQGTELQAVVATTDYDPEREEAVVRGILAWRPAAILLAGFEHTEATRRMLVQSGIRVAELMEIDQEPVDIAVGLSQYRAGHAIGRHLLGRGYRRFGYIGHDWQSDQRARRRHAGLCAALGEAGTAIEAELRGEGATSIALGRDLTARLRAEAPGVEVAIYSNDDMAVGGVFHCLAESVSLPDQFAIFGFNGLALGAALPQPLSTVDSRRFAIGHRAINAVLAAPARPEASARIDIGFAIVPGATA